MHAHHLYTLKHFHIAAAKTHLTSQENLNDRSNESSLASHDLSIQHRGKKSATLNDINSNYNNLPLESWATSVSQNQLHQTPFILVCVTLCTVLRTKRLPAVSTNRPIKYYKQGMLYCI